MGLYQNYFDVKGLDPFGLADIRVEGNIAPQRGLFSFDVAFGYGDFWVNEKFAAGKTTFTHSFRGTWWYKITLTATFREENGAILVTDVAPPLVELSKSGWANRELLETNHANPEGVKYFWKTKTDPANAGEFPDFSGNGRCVQCARLRYNIRQRAISSSLEEKQIGVFQALLKVGKEKFADILTKTYGYPIDMANKFFDELSRGGKPDIGELKVDISNELITCGDGKEYVAAKNLPNFNREVEGSMGLHPGRGGVQTFYSGSSITTVIDSTPNGVDELRPLFKSSYEASN
jgi:hypothetical protein